MRLATVRSADTTAVVATHGSATRLLRYPDVASALRSSSLQDDIRSAPVGPPPGELDFAPLVTSANKIICIGHNYRAHIAEMGHDAPRFPNVFSKFSSALIGAHDDIALDPAAEQWDWEAELAVVIGHSVHRADTTTARNAIAGYTVANDVSARDWQRRASQWLLGKTFDRTTPVGPWLVAPEEIDDWSKLVVQCSVDGVEKQRATVDLLFDPVELIVYLSQVCRLDPGDVILTGTPSGVGAARTPVETLRPGQVLQTSIDGIGVCTNHCVTA